MADGVNKVILLGNIGRDPELKVLGGGQAVLKLSVATNESFIDRNNQRQQRVEWHRVVVWGRRAEALSQFLEKGSQVHIIGKLQTREYEQDGAKRYTTEVVAQDVVVCGGRREGAGGGGQGSAAPGAQQDGGAGASDDDIPF